MSSRVATAKTTKAIRLMSLKKEFPLKKLISVIATFMVALMQCKLIDGRSFTSTAAPSYSGPPADPVESTTAPIISLKVRKPYVTFHRGANYLILKHHLTIL